MPTSERQWIKYRAEVKKYQVIRTTFYAYYCDAQHIVKECDENFLGIPNKKLMTNLYPLCGDNVKRQLEIMSQYMVD